MTTLDQASVLSACKVSCIPVRSDGTKKPAISSWAEYQERLPTTDELVSMFSDGKGGIAAVCGPVSDGLELMDFDVPDKPESRIAPAWKSFCELLKEHGHEDLLKRLLCVETPSGGKHLVYRCVFANDGNMKLAERADSKALIETRGRGGYFVVPPTDGYKIVHGSFTDIPYITEAERELLHVAARLQNEKWQRVAFDKNYPYAKRPGDDYAMRGESMEHLLLRFGWRISGKSGKWQNFTRPGKDEGISGGISADTGLFHAFTTSTLFDAGKGYNKFSVYSILEHGGDFIQAAKELAGLGYGEKGGAPKDERKTEVRKYPGTVEITDEEEADLWGTLDEVEEKAIEWFWHNRVPIGALTMIQGDPGIGKSTITMALIAAATSGGHLPGHRERLQPCHVVLVATEDDPGRVIKPRLRAMGANLSEVSVVGTEKKRADGTPVFSGIVTPDMVLRRAEAKGARLVIIDPLIESLAAFGIDPCKGEQVRPFLAKIRNEAERLGLAVLFVHHQNKMTGGKALYRAVGSIDIPASMRSVFVVGADPNNPETKAMAHVKSNWGALQPSIGYSVKDGVFGWLGEVSLSAEDMSQPAMLREDRDKASNCTEWLERFLKDGAVDATMVRDMAKELGYGRRALDSAKDALGIRLHRVTYGNKGAGGWTWALPEDGS